MLVRVHAQGLPQIVKVPALAINNLGVTTHPFSLAIWDSPLPSLPLVRTQPYWRALTSGLLTYFLPVPLVRTQPYWCALTEGILHSTSLKTRRFYWLVWKKPNLQDLTVARSHSIYGSNRLSHCQPQQISDTQLDNRHLPLCPLTGHVDHSVICCDFQLDFGGSQNHLPTLLRHLRRVGHLH